MPIEPLVITEAKALSALASPQRTRILDVLRVDGPSTASTLSERTGQAVGSVSHHLKVLAEAGFVEEAPELAKDRRERWWRRTAPSTRWSPADLADDPAAADAALAVENLQLATQFERTHAHLNDPELSPEWSANAFAMQTWLRLSPDELGELANELDALITRWSQRDLPDDGTDREPVLMFARGFPTRP